MDRELGICCLDVGKEISSSGERVMFLSPTDVYKFAVQMFRMDVLAEERVYMFSVDMSGCATAAFFLSKGSDRFAIVSPREVFIRACMVGASGIVLAHNHPSGTAEPSKEDKAVTARLKKAGVLIGIEVTDHIIVGDQQYYSFKEHGL